MNLVTVFLGAAEGLEAERRAFHSAVGEVNEAEGLARATLFVPLFVARKLHDQEVIDSNIQSSAYFLLALDHTMGPPGRSFEHDLRVALACRHDVGMPMREAVVLLKRMPADQAMEPAATAFRSREPVDGDPRRLEFDDVTQFQSLVRDLLSRWLRELAPERTQAVAGHAE